MSAFALDDMEMQESGQIQVSICHALLGEPVQHRQVDVWGALHCLKERGDNTSSVCRGFDNIAMFLVGYESTEFQRESADTHGEEACAR